MNTTVLVLGDESDWESYKRFCNSIQKYRSKKLNWVTATYDLLEKEKLPVIKTSTIVIYLFFPFTYWDKHIEKEGYDGLYGNIDFYNKFRVFWSEIHRTLKKIYRGKKICFINHPLKIAIDRDKELKKQYYLKTGSTHLYLITHEIIKIF